MIRECRKCGRAITSVTNDGINHPCGHTVIEEMNSLLGGTNEDSM